MSLSSSCRGMDVSFLAEKRWGATSLAAVGGVWSVADGARRGDRGARCRQSAGALPSLRESMDAGANASVLPAFSVASLVGFGAVVAALPAFAVVRDWVLAHRGRAAGVARRRHQRACGPDRLGLGRSRPSRSMRWAQPTCSSPPSSGIDPALMHRVAVIGAGTLDSLPHNGAVVTLLAVCGSTHARELSRHRHGRHRRRTDRARCRHRPRQPVGLRSSPRRRG